MNKTSIILLACLLTGTAHAKTYNSQFGFKADLPNHWYVLGSKQVSKANLEKTKKALKPVGIEGKKAEVVLGRIKMGNIEFLYDTKYSTEKFKNNISVQRESGNTPRTAEQAKAACDTLAPQLKKVFKQEITVKTCGLKKIDGKTYMAYEYSGAYEDVVTSQHEFQVSPNVTLVTVAGSVPAGLEHSKKAQLKIAKAIVAQMKKSPNYYKAMEKAFKALQAKKYKEAYKQFKIIEPSEDPEALFNLAVFYEHGKVVKANTKKSFDYYKRAARMQHRHAITKMGIFYLNGKGVKKNEQAAARLFYQAGIMGDPVAQNSFATMLFNGIGVKKKDPDTAIKWFTQSAQQGYGPAGKNLVMIFEQQIKAKNPKASHALAVLYLKGIGVKADTAKGIKLLEKAAFDGVAESRNALHEIYSKGLFGIAKNPQKAEAWKPVEAAQP